MEQRLRFLEAPAGHPAQSFCAAVEAGLSSTPRRLPCRFFYDAEGSRLFEKICSLPEYYITRTERELLFRHHDEILDACGRNLMLVELGCGNCDKTNLLIQSALKRQPTLHFSPIDISAAFLNETCGCLVELYPALLVTAVAGEYSEGLGAVPKHEGPRLFLFLGSNIGNMEAAEAVRFLRLLRESMAPQDRCLIGLDLVKERDVLRAAYEDAAGVTAEFNMNLLRRINRELGGQFRLEEWRHSARWVEEHSRIEMHLVSNRRQEVAVRKLDRSFCFEAGESIHTENSHKYSRERILQMAAASALQIDRCWQDERGWFMLCLFAPQSAP